MNSNARPDQEQWDGILQVQQEAHNTALAAFAASATASAQWEAAMANYEAEYEMVADVDPKTGETRLYLPSTYRSMAAARIRRDKKRTLRRELARQGITGVTVR